jgi:hypothetical protein
LGDTVGRLIPVRVNDSSSDFIRAGRSVTFSIKDGTLFGCGSNRGWALGLPNMTDYYEFTKVEFFKRRVTDAQSYTSTSVALLENGELYGVGTNFFGAFGMGDLVTLTNWTKLSVPPVAIAALSSLQLLVLTTDGKVWGSGSNQVICSYSL